MPAKPFSQFLSDKFKGTSYDEWKRNFPTFRKYALYLEQIVDDKKKESLKIKIDVKKDETPPKAISTHLIPPVNPEDVLVSWLAAKVDDDAFSQFKLWAEDVVNRAKLDAAANGVELEFAES